jgi:uncharacterized membrane-anchored protein YhcB (DUF1043 family)
VLLKGEQTGYQLNSNQIKVPNIPQTLKADQIVKLPLNWDSNKIPSDRYTGAAYISLEDAKERLIIPINLTMRIAPLIPLLVLFVGIICGRLIKYMQEKGIPQAETLGKVKELEKQVTQADREDQEILKPMLSKAENLVYERKLETATKEVDKTYARFESLQQLRNIEQKLEPLKPNIQPNEYSKIIQKVNNIREKIKNNQDEQVKTLLEKLQQDIDNLKISPMMGNKATFNLPEVVKELKYAVGVAVQSNVKKPLDKWVLRFQKSLIFLSGSKFRTQATYWFARPLFSLILLFGLSIVGLRSLYVQKGTTFGADPFSDYLGLFVWGLSADVASRSLSNLTGEEEKKE